MSTIALVLHDPAARRVREIWTLLEDRFGLMGVRTVPFPHLTLTAFEGLSHYQVKDLMERISQAMAPFMLEATGIGLFKEPARILYAPVVQTPHLHKVHHVLYEEIKALGGTIPEIYVPTRWVPHITLAQGEASAGSYGEAVDLLLKEDLHLSFEVRNLTLFDWIGPRYEPCDRFPLMGRAAKG
jgi:2'-5' RNA ligase